MFVFINKNYYLQVQKQKEQGQQQSKKVPLTTIFKCCVSGCFYTSINNKDLIQHIIRYHGPYKCIASGCQFVTKSRDLYEMHHFTLHPKVSYIIIYICEYRMCIEIFLNFYWIWVMFKTIAKDSPKPMKQWL